MEEAKKTLWIDFIETPESRISVPCSSRSQIHLSPPTPNSLNK